MIKTLKFSKTFTNATKKTLPFLTADKIHSKQQNKSVLDVKTKNAFLLCKITANQHNKLIYHR